MRIVVTGARDWPDGPLLRATLSRVIGQAFARGETVRLAHGGATGADTLAATWARRLGCEVVSYPVTRQDWQRLGPRAGPLRNRRMLEAERPDLVIGFFEPRRLEEALRLGKKPTSGTLDCLRVARDQGILWQLVTR